MKKLFIIAFLALGFYQAQAQVTFKPGLRGGLNFSHFTKGDSYNSGSSSNVKNDFTSKTDFYVGFYGALKLSKFYSLQPEINYSNQGSTLNYIDDNISKSVKLDVSYLSIAVINKFTFNKFNIQLGPTLDFVVDENNMNASNDVDFAFQLGAGYEVTKNFGLEARIKKGIVPAFYNNNDYGYYNNYDNNDHTNVVFSLGATYTFDVK